MALQSDAIESRLEGLKLDDRRTVFDSQLRAIRMESKSAANTPSRGSKEAVKSVQEIPIERVIALMEELSRRIDGLEKRDRALADEIRQRARQDRRRRSRYYMGGLATAGLMIVGWFLGWI